MSACRCARCWRRIRPVPASTSTRSSTTRRSCATRRRSWRGSTLSLLLEVAVELRRELVEAVDQDLREAVVGRDVAELPIRGALALLRGGHRLTCGTAGPFAGGVCVPDLTLEVVETSVDVFGVRVGRRGGAPALSEDLCVGLLHLFEAARR